jgi:hypothetical protein
MCLRHTRNDLPETPGVDLQQAMKRVMVDVSHVRGVPLDGILDVIDAIP